ncbi:MAG: carboxylating nicotinate-nucleotide diphosphorylase [Phycisphaerae bacterium]|nr:carboxylating nicotinate-nucleotide diphosphorylase [Phycisphaerae bacterium]
MHLPDKQIYLPLIQLARQEDLGIGDITSQATIAAGQVGSAEIVYRQGGIVAGMAVAETVLEVYDAQLKLEVSVGDGGRIEAGQAAGIITGPMRSLLAAERVLLNFLQRLSAIATLTNQYVQAVAGTEAKVCDTRKTTPGWRVLEKYAVRCGGGFNHRMGLYDAVMVKDNHLAALGGGNLAKGLKLAIENVRQLGRPIQFFLVEVDNLEQLEIVLGIDGVDIVLLDNMSLEMMSKAVAMAQGSKVLLEASGCVTLDNIAAIARTGVDRISSGALTHSIANLDIGLDITDN